jgi:hypothetical protein
MEAVDKKEILSIIERAEDFGARKIHRSLINVIVFTVLVISCQGG